MSVSQVHQALALAGANLCVAERAQNVSAIVGARRLVEGAKQIADRRLRCATVERGAGGPHQLAHDRFVALGGSDEQVTGDHFTVGLLGRQQARRTSVGLGARQRRPHVVDRAADQRMYEIDRRARTIRIRRSGTPSAPGRPGVAESQSSR